MKRSRSLWFAVGLVFTIASPATAKRPVRPVEEQMKIDFLVGEVRNSPAIFIRNGREYPASRAASHLSTRLKFAGRRVQNARQFVIGIASHSKETGSPTRSVGRTGGANRSPNGCSRGSSSREGASSNVRDAGASVSSQAVTLLYPLVLD